jgi:hypothetical protein
MEDQTYYTDCEVCGKHVKSHQEEGGYESRSYNRRTLAPHQERTLEAPEDSFKVIVCQTCLDKEPTLSSIMHKKRVENYEYRIQNCERTISQAKENIQRLKTTINEHNKIKQELLRFKGIVSCGGEIPTFIGKQSVDGGK